MCKWQRSCHITKLLAHNQLPLWTQDPHPTPTPKRMLKDARERHLFYRCHFRALEEGSVPVSLILLHPSSSAQWILLLFHSPNGILCLVRKDRMRTVWTDLSSHRMAYCLHCCVVNYLYTVAPFVCTSLYREHQVPAPKNLQSNIHPREKMAKV